MPNLELVESFGSDGPTPSVTNETTFDGLFIGNYRRKEDYILTQSLCKSQICAIRILDRYI